LGAVFDSGDQIAAQVNRLAELPLIRDEPLARRRISLPPDILRQATHAAEWT